MTVDVFCHAGDVEVLAARLAMDHLDLTRPLNDRESIYDICDADSSGWEAVFAALFEPGTQAEWRYDLGIGELISDVLFLHRSVFHPSLRDWQSYIIDHAATLFGEESVFVMWKRETDLTDSELADLGFGKIAGSNLRVRLNMLQHDYKRPGEGDLLDLDVPADAQGLVEERWK